MFKLFKISIYVLSGLAVAGLTYAGFIYLPEYINKSEPELATINEPIDQLTTKNTDNQEGAEIIKESENKSDGQEIQEDKPEIISQSKIQLKPEPIPQSEPEAIIGSRPEPEPESKQEPEQEAKPEPEVKSEQIIGCTDYKAINYNSKANTDDGSCKYPILEPEPEPEPELELKLVSGNLQIKADSGGNPYEDISVGENGTRNESFATFRILNKTSENHIRINKIIINRVGGRDSDFSKLYLYAYINGIKEFINRADMINGEAVFVPDLNYNPHADLIIYKDQMILFVVEADLNGTGNGVVSGDAPSLGIIDSSNVSAIGINSGESISSIGSVMCSERNLYKTIPFININSTNSSTIGSPSLDEKVLRFSIQEATSDGELIVNSIKIDIGMSRDGLYFPEFYDVLNSKIFNLYVDNDLNNPIATAVFNPDGKYVLFDSFTSGTNIPQGSTMYYTIKTDTTNLDNTDYSISLKVANLNWSDGFTNIDYKLYSSGWNRIYPD